MKNFLIICAIIKEIIRDYWHVVIILFTTLWFVITALVFRLPAVEAAQEKTASTIDKIIVIECERAIEDATRNEKILAICYGLSK